MSLGDPEDVHNELPFVDELQVLVPAPASAVWRALSKQFSHFRHAPIVALTHLLGTEPRRAAGGLLSEGSALPGFAVTEAVPGDRVRLTGRHRFSQYELILSLTTRPGGTMLSARSYARFPGLHGSVYRQLVIGSTAHRVLLGGLLRTVRRRAVRSLA
ncbi:MAG TPA: hypothetical protein VHW44_23390 [Pseudonocardiaceae bacterium]|nr:hypothetical protein [Pseudonocardiaceae bacterium]